jgi:hypothetical protein
MNPVQIEFVKSVFDVFIHKFGEVLTADAANFLADRLKVRLNFKFFFSVNMVRKLLEFFAGLCDK